MDIYEDFEMKKSPARWVRVSCLLLYGVIAFSVGPVFADDGPTRAEMDILQKKVNEIAELLQYRPSFKEQTGICISAGSIPCTPPHYPAQDATITIDGKLIRLKRIPSQLERTEVVVEKGGKK